MWKERSGAFLLLFALVCSLQASAHAELREGFYEKSCPWAEKIVSEFVKDHISRVPTLAAALLRMHFHDCFVRGCDASLLLNSTANNPSEKEALPNQTLRGFDFIDRVKALLEKECPGVVSCADIVALVARDAIVAIGGPYWTVRTGRRDGRISNVTESNTQIPAPGMNFSSLITNFGNKGLNADDLVYLSGAHTIGIAVCTAFSDRLFNFTGKLDQDPSMDPYYVANLKKICKNTSNNVTFVEMDPGSFVTFDVDYYRNLLKRRGLFTSDAALITNSASKSAVISLVTGPQELFFQKFASSMTKMSDIGVKTGYEGEIRKTCAVVN